LLPLLLVTVTIIAAKIEEPISPSIRRMISLLPPYEQEVVTVEKVIKLEEIVLIKLNFEMNFVSPLTFLERYLRLLNLHENHKVKALAVELSLRAMAKIIFLDYKPSIIAAAALVLAVSIRKERVTSHGLDRDHPAMINPYSLSCWSDTLQELTGYKAKELEDSFLLMATILTNIQMN
jgi:hypothetical protein